MEDICGMGEGDFGGRFEDWVRLLHPEDRERVLATVRDSLRRGSEHHVEHRLMRPDGSVRWVEGRGQVVHDAAGAVVGMIGVALDVTARRHAELERARVLAAEQRARAHLSFLAEASKVLAGSLDVEDTLGQVADLVVPRLADWCGIDLAEDGTLRQVALVHPDPDAAGLARRARERYGRSPGDSVGGLLGERKPRLVRLVSDGWLRSIAVDEQHLALLRRLGLGSVLVAPLRARGRTLGALSLARRAGAEPYDPDDLRLAEDLADRAGVAIDNARLYTEQHRLARLLQETLLPPELPAIPGVEVAARYATASPAVEIGGDFYDVLPNQRGGWTLLIGDVCGKGPAAAALTGLSRHTIRAAAARDADPARLLAVLNDVLVQHESPESFCTAVCGHAVVDGAEVVVRLAAGGHPPPLVARGSGAVETVSGTGMLIGLFPEPTLDRCTVRLHAGDTLVLYTDGVTEARRGAELFGVERLRHTLAGCAGRPAGAIAQRVHDAVLAFRDRPGDDVAVLVLAPAGRGEPWPAAVTP